MAVEYVSLGHGDATVLGVSLFSERIDFSCLGDFDADIVGLGDCGGHRPLFHLRYTVASARVVDMPLMLEHPRVISSIVPLSIGIIFKIPITHKPLTIRHGSLISTWIAC